MKPTSHGQVPTSPSFPNSSRGKSSLQTPKPGKTVPTPAPKPGTQKGRSTHDSIPKTQHPSRPLEAASILNNPRLQQVTGMHPRKASWWNGMHLPIDELIRLQWAMNLPDVYPVKRPRGNL
ncbi:hypothetical protein F4805DRAFT_160432 [Annulohypoxylon moriforme]|nr:hypothetical protein F4805DRAFT_160432 [Annulohypoxylon moriforme]